MCKHSEEVSNMSCPSTPLELNEKMLESMHFPPDIRHQLKELGSPSTILQRVSQHSLVMRENEAFCIHCNYCTSGLMCRGRSIASVLTIEAHQPYLQCTHQLGCQSGASTYMVVCGHCFQVQKCSWTSHYDFSKSSVVCMLK